jgi:hypothetical protein
MSSMLPIVIDSDDEVTVEKEDAVQLTLQEELMSSGDRVCAAILNKDVSGDLLLYGLQFEMVRICTCLPTFFINTLNTRMKQPKHWGWLSSLILVSNPKYP